MIIEGLLAKIAAAVFKKAAIGTALKWLAPAIEIYSIFDTLTDFADCVETSNDCHDMSVCGLHVVSDPLTDIAIDRLLTVGNTTFEVQQTSSGLYVANSLTPRFSLDPVRFPRLEIPSFPTMRTSHLSKPNFPKLQTRGR